MKGSKSKSKSKKVAEQPVQTDQKLTTKASTPKNQGKKKVIHLVLIYVCLELSERKGFAEHWIIRLKITESTHKKHRSELVKDEILFITPRTEDFKERQLRNNLRT